MINILLLIIINSLELKKLINRREVYRYIKANVKPFVSKDKEGNGTEHVHVVHPVWRCVCVCVCVCISNVIPED